MDIFTLLLVSGLFTGSIYSLIAIGFVVVYKSTKVLNFSQGMMVVLGAYVLWSMLSTGIPVWLAVIIAFLLIIAISIIIERICMRPLIGQPIMASVMVTLALGGALKGLIFAIWGSDKLRFPVEIISAGMWDLGFITLHKEKTLTLAAALALILVLYLFFKYTRIGLAMQVTSEDHNIAQIVGLNIGRIFSTSWAITGFIAAVGGLFLGSIVTIHPIIEHFGLKSLAAMLLGGLESIPGAIIGGLLIGLTETLAGQYLTGIFGSSIGENFPYILILIVLIIRPYGLFGWKKIERV